MDTSSVRSRPYHERTNIEFQIQGEKNRLFLIFREWFCCGVGFAALPVRRVTHILCNFIVLRCACVHLASKQRRDTSRHRAYPIPRTWKLIKKKSLRKLRANDVNRFLFGKIDFFSPFSSSSQMFMASAKLWITANWYWCHHSLMYFPPYYRRTHATVQQCKLWIEIREISW